MPVLARMVGHPALRSLNISSLGSILLDEPATAALLCDALCVNTRIATFGLINVGLWYNLEAATALLTTLQAMPSLTALSISENAVQPEDAAAACAALGAFIAHSPALESLEIRDCLLGDVGLSLVFDALPHARRIEFLDCRGNDQSEVFARERVIPAVRACATLRTLDMTPAVSDTVSQLLQRRCLRDKRSR